MTLNVLKSENTALSLTESVLEQEQVRLTVLLNSFKGNAEKKLKFT